ncbi:MAG: hypothetical protein WC901_08005 [Candidatus Margulisiibacteriota bacterium]
MNKIIGAFICLFVVGLVCAGCGNQKLSDAQSESVQVFKEVPKDERLSEFNDAFGKVSNEASAQAALGIFVEYVNSRVKTDATISARGNDAPFVSDDLIAKIAQKQASAMALAARGGDSSQVGISARKIAQTINSLTVEGQAAVPEEVVQEIDARVREALPNLAKNDSSLMQPIEAVVVGYVIHTGDDGGAGPSSVQVSASSEQVEQFVEKVIE